VTRYPNNMEFLKHYKVEHLYSEPDAKYVEKEIFVCNYCNHIFFNKLMLELHITSNHLHSNMLSCPMCQKKIKRTGLWRHVESHQVQSISTCPICFVKCKNTIDLREHALKHTKFYTCSKCGYESNKETSFTNHLKMHTEGVKSEVTNDNVVYENYYLKRKPKRKIKWQQSSYRYVCYQLLLVNFVLI
jgi:hypothetical protein